jgi:hypothetical protein
MSIVTYTLLASTCELRIVLISTIPAIKTSYECCIFFHRPIYQEAFSPQEVVPFPFLCKSFQFAHWYICTIHAHMKLCNNTFHCSSGRTSQCDANVVLDPTWMLLDWLHCLSCGAECAWISFVILEATVSVNTPFKSRKATLASCFLVGSTQNKPSSTAKKHPMAW